MTVVPDEFRGFRRSSDLLISLDRSAECAWVDGLTARLEPRGVSVRRVCSGDDALRAIEDRSMAMALLDAGASGRGGLGLLRRIRSIDRGLPCVLLASRVDGRYLRQALELRAFSVLITPVDERILRELIAAAFRKYHLSELEL